MTGGTVAITAGWALWGKEKGDVEYRLLWHSAGEVSGSNFEAVIPRYSPGTLDRLPQVTVGWLFDKSHDRHYLGMAIHADAGQDSATSRTDARGRAATATRYFCVPFDELAQGGISYSDLYAAVRSIRLPCERPDPILLDLPVTAPAPPSKDFFMEATRAAALLLTRRPVCIIGGGGAPAEQRLLFLDAVASLLPYGLRSRLSVSTWASSAYERHRIRLFFSSTPRKTDQVLEWGRISPRPIGVPIADVYMNWLWEGDRAERVTALAGLRDVMEFSEADLSQIPRRIARLQAFRRRGKPSGGREAQTQAIPQPAPDREPEPVTSGRPAPAADSGVADLLRTWAQDPTGADPLSYAEALRLYLDEPAGDREREHYQQVIKETRLLCDDRPISKAARSKLYGALLPLAFGVPLTYRAYCAIEDCAGTPAGQAPAVMLLLAIEDGELAEDFLPTLIRLLCLEASGDMSLGKPSLDGPLAPASLLRLVAEPRLLPQHARLAWEALSARSPHLDRPAIRRALHDLGYLARDPEQWCPGEPEEQVTVLSRLLRLAYGHPLDADAIADIRSRSSGLPAEPLIAAIRISAVGYSDANRAQNVSLLAPDGAAPEDGRPDPGNGPGNGPGKKFRLSMPTIAWFGDERPGDRHDK